MNNTERRIKLIGVGVSGQKFVSVFENNINRPDILDVNAIYLKEDNINLLNQLIHKTNPLNMNGCGTTKIYDDSQNKLIEDIKNLFKSSLKITFVVDSTRADDIKLLEVLIKLAKAFYGVFDVILVAPGQKEKDSKAQDNFEICQINLKRNLIKHYIVELNADYISLADVNEKTNKSLLVEAFVIAIHEY